MNKLNEILAALRERGIRLWLDDGKLRFQGPEGSMTPELRERLLACKEEVIAFLASAAPAPAANAPRAVSRDGALPMSSMQSRLLFIDEMGSDKAAYNLPLAVELQGELRVDALQASLDALVARHESLRTRFERDGAHYRLVIDAAGPVALPIDTVDAQALDPLCRHEAASAFTLAGGTLFRVRLCRIAERHHVLLLTMHHIVSDGWSIGVLLRDLGELYRAQCRAENAALPALPLQYVDFSQWQADIMESAAIQQQEKYWRAKLDGAAPLLNLPTDHVRPAVQSMGGRTERFTVPAALHARLTAFCQDAKLTPYTVLLAAFQCLLARYAGQADVSVGIASANRRHEQFEPVVGMFMNTLVLRSQIGPDATFRELLAQANAALLEAQENQDVPFERLVEIAQPERSLSYAPLFQVMMMYQDAPSGPPAFGELDARVRTFDSAVSKYDLTLSFERSAHALEGGIEYSSALFLPETIVRMHGHYLQLLGALLERPARPVTEHALLTAAEFDLMTRAWNATGLTYQALPVFDAIEAQARRAPGEEALVFAGDTLAYGALLERVAHVAAHLQDAGVTPGDRIGIFMDRSADMVVAMLAVLKSGAAYVPLDPAYPRERLRYICEDAGLALCLTQSFLLADRPHDKLNMLAVDSLLTVPVLRGAPTVTVPAEQTAYMIYTSGSTGHPKGVMVSHRNVANLFAALDQRLTGASEQRPCWLAVTSISFDISVLELLWTLSRGHKVVLQPPQVPQTLAAAQAGSGKGELDFSLFYFASDSDACPDNRYKVLLDGARFADRNGFRAVWVPERHFHAFGGQYPNPSVAAAAIAAITTRVQVRAGSVVLPLHDPIRIAEEWSMVDNLSQGRTGIAFASGWHFDDFVFFPDRYETRHHVLREGIETVRNLWRGESVLRKGGTGKDTHVTTRPRPIQAELPVWITAAASPETFRYAGEIGANVLTHLLGQNLEELKEKIDIYRRALEDNGHCPHSGQVTLMMHTFIGDDIDAVRSKVEQPFKSYLRSSVNLLRPVAESQGLDPSVDLEAVVDASFERYFGTSALFGTPSSCLDLVAKVRAIGVTEVACLVDFGIPVEEVLGGLNKLAQLKDMSNSVSARLRHFEMSNREDPADLVRKHGVTHIQSTPSFAGMLLDQLGPQGAAISQWLVGGEPLPMPTARRIMQAIPGRLHNMYGPTETTVWSSSDAVEADAITLGRPFANTALYVLDAHLQPVPIGVPGELYIGGDGVSQGYWQRAQLTAEKFMPNPFGGVGERMYRTGDLVRFRPDGKLQFLGRNDGQVKLRGFRIELGEIETLLRQHAGVREAAVRLLPGSGDQDAQLVAYVVPEQATAGQAPAEHGVNRFQFPDGTTIFHTDERQLGALYKEVFADRMYMKHGIVLEDNACIFDVGANVGTFSVFAQLNCSNPIVYAFEPIPPTYAALHSNLQWHGVRGKTFNCGLSDRAEVQEFTYYPHMSGLSGRFANAEEEMRAARSVIQSQMQQDGSDLASMSDQEVTQWLEDSFRSQSFACQLRTLSDVIRAEGVQQIDLLKVDVEKSECLVLAGIEDADWPKIQQIALEVDGKDNLAWATELLERQGYLCQIDGFVNVEASEGIEEFHVYMVYARRAQVAKPLAPSAVSGQGLSVDAVKAQLRARLPAYMVPDAVMLLDAMPRTPNGKLDARALPLPGQSAASAPVLPRSEQERTIAAIWHSVLGRSSIGVNDNFFESGGNSLLVAKVRTELQEAFARDISVIELFRYPTIASLATFLASGGQDGASVANASDRGAERRKRMAGRNRAAA